MSPCTSLIVVNEGNCDPLRVVSLVLFRAVGLLKIGADSSPPCIRRPFFPWELAGRIERTGDDAPIVTALARHQPRNSFAGPMRVSET